MVKTPDIDGRVDDIVATCNGDVQGALKALLLVNEHLECELRRISAMAMGALTVSPAAAAPY